MFHTTMHEAITALEGQIAVKRREIEKIERAIEELRPLVAASHPSGAVPPALGVGATEMARRCLANGRQLSTRELREAMEAAGWRTTSRNPTATIHATLTNSKEFERTDDGRWKWLGSTDSDLAAETE